MYSLFTFYLFMQIFLWFVRAFLRDNDRCFHFTCAVFARPFLKNDAPESSAV